MLMKKLPESEQKWMRIFDFTVKHETDYDYRFAPLYDKLFFIRPKLERIYNALRLAGKAA